VQIVTLLLKLNPKPITTERFAYLSGYHCQELQLHLVIRKAKSSRCDLVQDFFVHYSQVLEEEIPYHSGVYKILL